MAVVLRASLLFLRSASCPWVLSLGFSSSSPLAFALVFPLLAHALPLRPYSSVCMRCRNLYLLSIDYALKPRLRSRLPQGRSALPWNPWIFGHEDSHLVLATHSGILSCMPSTAPCRYSFSRHTMLLYQKPALRRFFPRLRWCVSAPDIFGAGPLD